MNLQTRQEKLEFLATYFDARDAAKGNENHEVQDDLREIAQYITRLEKALVPCSNCGGSGELDDADFGDISFNVWDCPECDGYRGNEDRDKLREEINGRINSQDR